MEPTRTKGGGGQKSPKSCLRENGCPPIECAGQLVDIAIENLFCHTAIHTSKCPYKYMKMHVYGCVDGGVSE